MRITSLRFKNYRCFERFELSNLGKFVCLVGANGSGKTSVLELLVRVLRQLRNGSVPILEEEMGPPDERLLNIELQAEKEEIREIVGEGLWSEYHEIWKQGRHFPLIETDEQKWERDQRKLQLEFQRKASFQSIFYSPYRSWVLPDSISLDYRLADYDEVYRESTGKHYGKRVEEIAAKLGNLIINRREKWAQITRNAIDNNTQLDTRQYKGIPEIDYVFDIFFSLTGKKFAKPRFSNGRYSFSFNVPWSNEPLPLRALSSGEQWVLLFFIEMELKNWKNHILLIDELEQHLHPDFAIRFVDELRQRKDSNQYWITTHSPTIANYFGEDTFGLILNERYRSEVVPYPSSTFEVMNALAGSEGLIPVAKTIVFLEGRRVPNRLYSVDQTFFKELQMANLISKNIEFVSVGHSKSVESYQEMLQDFEKEYGAGLRFYAIRDRDGLPSEIREEAIQIGNGRFWIWQRNSIEGYLLEPEILTCYCHSLHMQRILNPEQVETLILETMNSQRNDIISRYENRLVESVLPIGKKATVRNSRKIADKVSRQKEAVDRFTQRVENWFINQDYRSLLCFADCKKLLKSVLHRLVGQGPRNERDFAMVIHQVVRDVVKPKLMGQKPEKRNLSKIWPEIDYVLRKIAQRNELQISMDN